VTPVDEKFIRKATETVEKHIADKSFNMDYFGKKLGMSRFQLFRKLKSLTNLTPSNFITIIRLEQAKQLIKESHASMSEIAYDVGFSSPAYFSRCFRDKYGISPTEFAEQSK
jgi:AraC-like DNA-binding protein